MLYRTKVQDKKEAGRWLQVAARELPPGAWRDFLVTEFKLKKEPDEETPAEWTDYTPEPAT
jgi:hypothetical protein